MTATALEIDLGILAEVTQGINEDVADIESCTVEQAVASLKQLREAIAVLKMVDAGIERWISRCFDAEGWRDPHELPGLGMVEVRRSRIRREWDHEDLKRTWLRGYMESLGGEVPDVADIRDALFKVISVSGWKVTGLRELGIDPEDYCSSEAGTPRVVLA